MAKISLLVCSRISGNKNFGLFNLLDSLKRMSSHYDNFEVLVKFDTDDKKASRILPKLMVYPFKVKYIVEPRGRGYLDLHVFYNRLLSLVDEESIVIGAMADDFVVTQASWDEVILSKVNVFPDRIFIMHGRPHPPISRKNYQEQKFHLDFDINTMGDLHIIDEAPMWSRKLLDICGGFGHLSFTDCWTLMLEYYLFHRCGMNRTIFLEHPIIERITKDAVDQQISQRWWSDRAENFNFVRSRFYETCVEQQALNIFCYVKMAETSALPSPLVQKESDFKPRTITPDEFKRLKHQHRMTRMKTTALNLFPPPMRPGLTRVYKRLFSSSSAEGVKPTVNDK